MKFTLLYVYDPTTTSPSEGEIADWLALDAEYREKGILVHAEGFYHRDEGKVVRVRDGATAVEDQPTTPAGNTVAGFIVVEAPHIEAATALAARVPTAKYGYIDVRRVVEWEA
jgi:hypothetical protein